MPEIIKYDDPVVLVGGGEVDVNLLRRFTHLPIIAADGGANLLRKASLEPSVVIGDLDSLQDADHWREVANVVELEEQDTTDFEKCLYSIEAPYFIAFGFTGNRLDHTLAALHVMQKWHLEKLVVLISGEDVVCVKSDAIELSLPVGTRLSLYPLNKITFESSSGLEYPLENLFMQTGQLIGTSNSCVEAIVKIVPSSGGGCYALIVPVSELNNIVQAIYTGAVRTI